MNYLLDTHAFLWLLFSPKQLSKHAREVILNDENDVYVSTISFWEISIKCNLGKIRLPKIDPSALPSWAKKAGIAILDLKAEEAASFHSLPKKAHKDPFDRMLVWQAIQNEMMLLTKDRSLKEYQKLGLNMEW